MSTSFEIDTWVIRCQGLPRRDQYGDQGSYDGYKKAVSLDLVRFFYGCNFKNGVESVHFSTDRRDEVYIEMASRNDLQKAVKKDKKYFESPQRNFYKLVRGNFK